MSKIVYQVKLHQTWKSNINGRKFTSDSDFHIISDRGAEFAVLKAKSFALKQRVKGQEHNTISQVTKKYDDSCITVALREVKETVEVDC